MPDHPKIQRKGDDLLLNLGDSRNRVGVRPDSVELLGRGSARFVASGPLWPGVLLFLPFALAGCGTDTTDSARPDGSDPIEICDGVDNDGDGAVDEGLATVTLHADADGDGFGDPENTIENCTLQDGWLLAGTDCDDGNPAVHPGADETCNRVDDDCDGAIDDGLDAGSWYDDADADGFGVDSTPVIDCAQPPGTAEESGDCDDTNSERFPGATEVCDGLDDDCDGELPWDEMELDGDGWLSCDGDCWPHNPDAYPGAPELCDGYDDDCDGDHSGEEDADGDGFRVCDGDCNDDAAAAYPGAPQVECDGLDNDCDGVISADEADADGDGVMRCSGDCDDADGSREPRALEVCDGVDNDCDHEIDDTCVTCDIDVPADFGTVQAAIDAAVDGQRVCVGAGVWVERLDFGGKAIELAGVGGPYGTVLDGGSGSYDLFGPVVTFASGETSASRLTGFTIQHGGADSEGGGLAIIGASPTLDNLVIRDNLDIGQGGGVRVESGSPTLSDSLVADNAAELCYDDGCYGEGGGIYVEDGSLLVDDVRIEGNSAGYGGGVFVEDGDLTMSASAITQNLAVDAGCGGGLMVGAAGEVSLANVVITANSARRDSFGNHGYGGGVCLAADADVTLVNVVVATNTVDGNGGGIYTTGGLTLTNTVLSGNSASSGGGIYASVTAPVTRYSDLYGNTPDDVSGMPDPVGADGNIAVDPAVADPGGSSAASWHLSSASPLIDAGDPTVFDPDGSTSDIGVYGGSGAAGLDHDFDGYAGWWLPGPYDPLTSPGLDCDDDDPVLLPGAGC